MSLLGERIGKIRIIDRLGEGGMGSVFVGFDEKLERKVAVKAISGQNRFNPQAKRRFAREAKVLSRLEHPHICRIYDFIEEDEHDFLVMELIRGRELTDVAGKMSWKTKMRVAGQIADVLAEAHGHHIVHRDLKPQNIMVTDRGDVKVLDFGLAHAVMEAAAPTLTLVDSVPETQGGGDASSAGGDEMSFKTEKGVIAGTPMFMSPEQALGDRVTAASDMYSLGLLLQWLFTGKLPFPPDLNRYAMILAATRAESLPVEGLDADLGRLINRLKSSSPENRPIAQDTRDRLQWIHRKPMRRARALAVAAFIALLVFGITLVSIGFHRAARQADNAKQTIRLLEEFLSSVDPGAKGKDLMVRDLLESFKPRLQELEKRPLIQASLYQTYATTYRGLGLNAESRACAEKAYALRKSILGAEHRETLESLNTLAIAANDQGHYDEAEQMQRQCLETRTRVLGKEHPETLNSLNELANVFFGQGKYEKAEKLHRQCLNTRVQVLGEDHKYTLSSIHNVAVALFLQGKYRESEPWYRKCLSSIKRVLGEEHPDTLLAMEGLANVLQAQGEYGEAEPLHRQCLEIRKRILGETHPKTLSSLNNLAAGLFWQKKYDEAEVLFRQCLEIRNRVLGAEHPETLISMGNLAWNLALQNKHLDEAEQLASQCLNNSMRLLGRDHPYTPTKMSILALVLEKKQQMDDAVEWYRQAAEMGDASAREALKRLAGQREGKVN